MRKAMLDQSIRRLLEPAISSAGTALARLHISANVVTILGFGCGLGAAAAIADERNDIGFALFVLNRLADLVDGAIARRKGPTSLGAFLDASLDFIVYAAIPFGFALAYPQNALAAAFLLFGLMVNAVPALAFRAFAQAERGFSLLEHSETFIAFALMCLAPRWMFSPLAYLYGTLCLVSGGVRIIAALAKFSASAKS
jgi:phosphatidylglycerophosphate synthase